LTPHRPRTASIESARHRGAAFWRLWGWPLLLGLLSAAGLVGALLLDGLGDLAACLGVGAPLLAIGWHSLKNPARP
jgi:hypothetical protein